ncbi:hypothetical protein [Staphylococcus phage IME-SA119]|uniref:Uncharacterized protein n=1 Tax=Staphylococcus phage IME-SA119 TaxID=1673874 RepID=A0A0H4TFY6_9CAUD|nr:hypothetical protein QLX46_gp137 [Staphylococcus phage IME-SA119]AKQ07295.1 hypothetical protein [Staphylococcus phage IME-SA119]
MLCTTITTTITITTTKYLGILLPLSLSLLLITDFHNYLFYSYNIHLLYNT